MRAACVVLLFGCGFHSNATGVDDAMLDAAPSDSPDGTIPPGAICASIITTSPFFRAAACGAPMDSSVHISNTVSLDTEQATSTPAGLTCTKLPYDHLGKFLCAVVAPEIVIEPGGVLSAHGPNPLVLFAHTITIRGTVDVASHLGGAIGAGSALDGCSSGHLPKGHGGGRGGFAVGQGGTGGDEGGMPMTGGTIAGTFIADSIFGGCGGTLGGDGSPGGDLDGGNGAGGAGGGAVWIAADTTLVLASTAIINASGAGGLGAIAEGHGGSGGGSGGIIVLQAPTINADNHAAIFANGGHGGGGAGVHTGFTPGVDGTDPSGPTSGGSNGTGGADGAMVTTTGDGGPGFPLPARDGQPGVTTGHGGGGGGGGAGAIFIATGTGVHIDLNVSPPPVYLHP